MVDDACEAMGRADIHTYVYTINHPHKSHATPYLCPPNCVMDDRSNPAAAAPAIWLWASSQASAPALWDARICWGVVGLGVCL